MCLSGIYKIENKFNKKVYIGQSTNIKQRWKTHLNKLRQNKHQSKSFQSDYNTFTEDAFEFSILEIAKSKRDLYIYESYYVDLYKSFGRELYNVKNLHSYNDIVEINSNIDAYIEDLKSIFKSIPELQNEDKTIFKAISLDYMNSIAKNSFTSTKLAILKSLIDFDYRDIFRGFSFDLYGEDTFIVNYTPYKLLERASKNHNYMMSFEELTEGE